MSFNLEFGQSRLMNAAEISQLRIDQNGNSSHPCYRDSIFSVIHFGEKNYYSYKVTRLPKADLEIPLNQPIQLTWQKVTVLRIEESGYSKRPDLAGYKFTTRHVKEGVWEVTKHKQ